MTKEILGRYTPVEAVLMGASIVLAVVSLVWFSLGEPGHREGQWLLIPSFVLAGVVIVLRRRRGAKN